MKSPSELKQRLRRQWEHSTTRVSRLSAGNDNWPVTLPIGKPKPSAIRDELDSVKRHVDAWRSVRVGEVSWEAIQYRSTAEPVNVPVRWILHKPTDWIDACADVAMRNEFDTLCSLVADSDACFHDILVRRRSLWRDKPASEVIQAARLAMQLEPGSAGGQPLRTLSLVGIDTKFFERNSGLMTTLLDLRFDDEVSKLGLEVFLGAFVERDHWLLLVDLDGGLLPFQKQRVASTDLKRTPLPGTRVLIVENETCQHQLPEYLPGTIAVLGAGFDLSWTDSPHLADKQVGYWGDIDTWGFQFLAQARRNIAHLQTLLMASNLYEANRNAAVIEPVSAGTNSPSGLSENESQLYQQLLKETNGRLEQEFLPKQTIQRELRSWAGA